MARRHDKKKKKGPAVEEDLDRFAGSSEEENEEENDEQEVDENVSSNNDNDKNVDAIVESSDDEDSVNEAEEYVDMKQPKPSLGMSGAMARILGAPAQGASPSVVLSKTTTPLQRLLQQERNEQKLQREKRKLNRQRNLQALHVPLSVATTRATVAVNDETSNSSVAVELQEERLHRRVATRGVVALFNAIAQHQQQTKTNAALESNRNTEKQEGKLTKHGFLDMIKTKAVENSTNKTTPTTTAETNASTNNHGTLSKPKKWNALSDDYMLNSKLKDWDKESSSSSNEQENEHGDEWSDNDEPSVEDGRLVKKQRV